MSRAPITYADAAQTAAEIWQPVNGHVGFEVSNAGNVRRAGCSPKKLTIDAAGYLRVGLWDGERTLVRLVHQLVCEAFHGPAPSPAHEVAHRDGVKSNCREDNLRWATRAENNADKYAHGTHLQGDACPWAKLTRADVEEIRRAPKRVGECARLAAKFGITKNHVAKIRTRSRGIWPDVPFPEVAHA